MSGHVHVGLYGEIDMNLVDGSSVWLQSLGLVLVSLSDVEVTVLLRTPSTRLLLTAPLHEHERCRVVDPGKHLPGVRRLEPSQAVDLIEQLDRERPFDVLILRGASVADEVVRRGSFDKRLWLYHVPVHGVTAHKEAAVLRARTKAAARILYQTEEIRAHIEVAVPEARSKLVALPPMIPAPEALPYRESHRLERLFYAGKLAPEYFFLEMVEVLRRIRATHPRVELDVAGDKVHRPPGDPGFKPAAEAALRSTPGLAWHGAVPREEVRRLAQASDIALSIRHPRMDSSTELSTKILEYGAAGCAVMLNRNAVHEGLLGVDYPLLVSGVGDAVERLREVADDHDLLREARVRCFDASQEFTFERAAAALAPHLRATATRPVSAPHAPAVPYKVLVVGHALGFFSEIADRIAASGAEVREDLWTGHASHDEAMSLEALAWADTVICEWCLGNAVWYSRHKQPQQRLIVRMHRQETETDYPGDVDLDSVDAMVFVAKHIRDAACDAFGWQEHDPRFHIVPNAIDVDRLFRRKLPGAEFNLGMIGWVNYRKRLDRALDIAERVRAKDDRFRLVLKGKGPWEFGWMLNRADERRFYDDMFRRIRRSPLLGPAVTFEGYGDVADFLEAVGFILSLSDSEGHPVGVAEGMASGAAPVIFDRPGASDQYPLEWVHESAADAAEAILATTFGEGQANAGERGRAYVQQWDWDSVRHVWGRIVFGQDLPLAAR